MQKMCEPCPHCKNLYDDSDESVGYYGYGCTFQDNAGDEDEWEPGCGRPCPGFSPILPSEFLEVILFEEAQQRDYDEEEGDNDEQ